MKYFERNILKHKLLSSMKVSRSQHMWWVVWLVQPTMQIVVQVVLKSRVEGVGSVFVVEINHLPTNLHE